MSASNRDLYVVASRAGCTGTTVLGPPAPPHSLPWPGLSVICSNTPWLAPILIELIVSYLFYGAGEDIEELLEGSGLQLVQKAGSFNGKRFVFWLTLCKPAPEVLETMTPP